MGFVAKEMALSAISAEAACMPEGEPSGVFDMVDQLHVTDSATTDKGFVRLNN